MTRRPRSSTHPPRGCAATLPRRHGAVVRPAPDAGPPGGRVTCPGGVGHDGSMRDGSSARAGMLLVATPELVDPNFSDTVVLLLDVDEQGALGVVLNRPTPVAVS